MLLKRVKLLLGWSHRYINYKVVFTELVDLYATSILPMTMYLLRIFFIFFITDTTLSGLGYELHGGCLRGKWLPFVGTCVYHRYCSSFKLRGGRGFLHHVSYAKCYQCLWIHCPFLIDPSDFTYVYIMIKQQIQNHKCVLFLVLAMYEIWYQGGKSYLLSAVMINSLTNKCPYLS